MLIREQLETHSFSPAEENAVKYIVEFPENVEKFSIQKIAQETYTQPSTLVRVAKKLGYTGWKAFKKDYLEEWQYLRQHFIGIDANLPFNASDSIMSIMKKMVALQHSTLDDIQSLLHHDQLSQAKRLLLDASEIMIFAQNANLLISQDFALKMNRIGKRTLISSISGEERYNSFSLQEDACAIFISYSGENEKLLNLNRIIKKRGISTIAITSIGDNQLSKNCDCFLPISTREKLYSKIGNFTTNQSVIFLLDLLYSLVFSEHYQENLQHLVSLGQVLDTRKISTDIMKED